MSSNNVAKVNVSDEHRHMIRLYMVHHRLPSMQAAVARMVEAVMASEGPYTYSPPKELASRGAMGTKAG